MHKVEFLTNPSFKFHHSEGRWLLFRKSFFILESDLVIKWKFRGKIYEITVKKGFITDFASIPRILWRLFPPFDEMWGLPAIGHDGLYGIHAFGSRAICDIFIKEAIESKGGGEFTHHSFYDALWLLGWAAWYGKTKKIQKKNLEFVKIEEEAA